MTNIQVDTWIKYTYWMAIGLMIYFCYGIWNSTERNSNNTASKDDEKERRPSTSLSMERSNNIAIVEEIAENRQPNTSTEAEE